MKIQLNGNTKRKYCSIHTGLGLAIGISASASAITIDPEGLEQVGMLHQSQAVHVDQKELVELAKITPEGAFALAFAEGDELFETVFNALDGVGANVGNGQRFTRVPRADLQAWREQTPPRPTGPNGEACNHCHAAPFDDGAGPAALNVHRDPTHSADMDMFIQRNTPHLFGLGALQLLAEEMTERLHRIRDNAGRLACRSGLEQTRTLRAKGVSYGEITAIPSGTPCEATFDTSAVEGINADLIVRPYQWKGSDATVRGFNRDASNNELGMQPVETVGAGIDGDGDGIVDEMTIGDQTAMVIYTAAQPRPTTTVELASLGLVPALTNQETRAINRGRAAFRAADCHSCHKFRLIVEDPIFTEPSQNPNYRDAVFPAGQDPIAEYVDPAIPIAFDLTKDLPDNQIPLPNGEIYNLGSFKANARGGAIVEAFTDLKHHDMGPGLAETIDETGSGESVWMTKELWGVGSTAPYMHDGRSTTITEAILEHGGESADSRDRFLRLPSNQQQNLVDFLNSLVLFKQEEE